jgi:uncharacterized protein DUF4242
MPYYIVERHLPGITAEQLSAAAARAKSVTAEMTSKGKPVRYLRTTFIPSEDKAFCLFDATIKRAGKRGERTGANPAATDHRSTTYSRRRRGLSLRDAERELHKRLLVLECPLL